MLAAMQVRRTTNADLPAVVATITDAFLDDPMWVWAFPDVQRRAEHYQRWWGVFVASAARYNEIWLADDAAAVAVWIPPGGQELDDEQAAQLEPLLRDTVGPWTSSVLEGLDRFENAHPHEEPHYYLSLLGTRSDRRGEGLGMALLAQCLAAIDAEQMPAYLESTNPVNNRRYERAGFVNIGSFAMPLDGPTVTRMWRPAGGAAFPATTR